MSRRINSQLLLAKSALDTVGSVDIFEMSQLRELGFHIEYGAGTGAGTVLIETASSLAYTGTWAVIATVAWAAASKSHYVAVTGVMRVVRARISVAVTGGTVDCYMVGNAY